MEKENADIRQIVIDNSLDEEEDKDKSILSTPDTNPLKSAILLTPDTYSLKSDDYSKATFENNITSKTNTPPKDNENNSWWGWKNIWNWKHISKSIMLFMLKKTIGNYLESEENLTAENIDINWNGDKGTVVLKAQVLNTEVLNGLVATLPITIVEGAVDEIRVTMPWNMGHIWKWECDVELDGLRLTVKHAKKDLSNNTEETDTTDMSSSFYLAKDFFEQDPEEAEELGASLYYSTHADIMAKSAVHDTARPSSPEVPKPSDGLDGVQRLANFIESVREKIKFVARNTNIRFEHTTALDLGGTDKKYYLNLRVGEIIYRSDDNLEDLTASLSMSKIDASTTLSEPVLNELKKTLTIKELSISLQGNNYNSCIFSTLDNNNHIHIAIRKRIYPEVVSSPNMSSSTVYTQTALKQTLQSPYQYDIQCIIKNIIAVCSPCQVAFIMEIITSLTQESSEESNRKARTSANESSSLSRRHRDPPQLRGRGLRNNPLKYPTIVQDRNSMLTYEMLEKDLDFPDEAASPPPYLQSHFNQPSLPASQSMIASSILESNSVISDRPEFSLPARQSVQSQPIHPTLMADIKVKLQVISADFFLVYKDSNRSKPISVADLHSPGTSTIKPPRLDNLRIQIKNFTTRYTEWENHSQSSSSSVSPPLFTRIGIREEQYTPMPSRIAVEIGLDLKVLEQFHNQGSENIVPIITFPKSSNDTKTDALTIHTSNKGNLSHGSNGQAKKQNVMLRIERGPALTREQAKMDTANRITASNSREVETNMTLYLDPIHIYVDVRILDRLENYLERFAFSSDNTSSKSTTATPTFTTTLMPEDLEGVGGARPSGRMRFNVRCDLIRISIAAPDMRGLLKRDDLCEKVHKDLLIAELINLKMSTGKLRRHFREEDTLKTTDSSSTKVKVDCKEINVFLKQHAEPEPEAVRWFTATGALSKLASTTTSTPSIDIIFTPTPTKRIDQFKIPDEDPDVLRFKGRMRETSMFYLNCSLPVVHVDLSKSIWDTIQILQNDLVTWQPHFLSKISKNSAEKERKEKRVDSANLMSLISLEVSMADATFRIATSPLLFYSNQGIYTNTYELSITELSWLSVVKYEGRDENVVCMEFEDFVFSEVKQGKDKLVLVHRTIPHTYKVKTRHRPMFLLISQAFINLNEKKQDKKTQIYLNEIYWEFSIETGYIENLIKFQQDPEEISYIEPFNQTIDLTVLVNNTSISYKPVHLPSQLVLVLGRTKLSTKITNEARAAGGNDVFRMALNKFNGYLIDDRSQGYRFERSESIDDTNHWWELMGFVKVLSIENDQTKENLVAKLARNNDQQLDLELVNDRITLDTCADSFNTLMELVSYFASQGDLNEEKKNALNEEIISHQNESKHVIADIKVDNIEADIGEILKQEKFLEKTSRSRMNESEQEDPTEKFIFKDDHFPSDNIVIRDQGIVKSPPKPKRDTGIVKVLGENLSDLHIVEDYFSPKKNSHNHDSSMVTKMPQVIVKEFKVSQQRIILNFYDGYDWKHVREERNKDKEYTQSRRSSEGGEIMSRGSSRNSNFSSERINQFDTDSEYFVDFSEISNQTSQTDPKRTRRRKLRSRSSYITMDITELNTNVKVFQNDAHIALLLLAQIRDIEVIDNVPSSLWNKFLARMRPEHNDTPQDTESNMVRLEVTFVRPDLKQSSEEIRLKARLLPMRMYIDQDALNFLITFLTFQNPAPNNYNKVIAGDPIYFQYVDIQPIALKVDYKPKHIDLGGLKEGNLVELINIFRLDAAEVKLKEVILKGVKGWPRLAEELASVWLPHITGTQVPNMLSGVAPIRSLVNLSSGVADLILLPIEQYKKDGRIIKGIQRGTQAFAKATTVEAINIGTRVASGAQNLLEQADDMLVNSNRKSRQSFESEYEESVRQEVVSKFADQPASFSEGLEQAYNTLSKNLGSAAHTILAVPMRVYETDTTAGPPREVIKAVPIAVLKTTIGAAGALSNILLGIKNSIDPNNKLLSEDKYKRRND